MLKYLQSIRSRFFRLLGYISSQIRQHIRARQEWCMKSRNRKKINEFSPLIIFAFLHFPRIFHEGSFSWIIDELNRLFQGEIELEIIYQEMGRHEASDRDSVRISFRENWNILAITAFRRVVSGWRWLDDKLHPQPYSYEKWFKCLGFFMESTYFLSIPSQNPGNTTETIAQWRSP